MESKATAIATVKQEMRIQEWTSQIEAQQVSGMTVKQWCKENGIKPNTYYNRLQKVRTYVLDSAPAIVPLNIPRQREGIHIEKNGVQITLPTDTAPETLLALVKALCRRIYQIISRYIWSRDIPIYGVRLMGLQ